MSVQLMIRTKLQRAPKLPGPAGARVRNGGLGVSSAPRVGTKWAGLGVNLSTNPRVAGPAPARPGPARARAA